LCVNCESRIPLWDEVETRFAGPELEQRVRELQTEATRALDHESRELSLRGEVMSTTASANQIFRTYSNSDFGIDGEIEFKDDRGQPTGRRLYVQLKAGDSYITRRKDGTEVFRVTNPRWLEYWLMQPYPVMLVVRTSDGQIRWMNATEAIRRQRDRAE